MTKTRIFVSWRAEEKWLNAMGAKGYRLADVDAFDYKFTVAAGKTFVYSLEWLDVSPLSDEGERFAAERAESGFSLCASKRGWAYYIREGADAPEKDAPALRLTMRHYRAVSLFLLVLFLVFTGLTAYNFFYQSVFAAEGYTIPKSSISVELFRSIYNNLLVGKNPATVLLLLLVPVTAVLLLLCAFFGSEYFATRRLVKQSELRRLEQAAETAQEDEAQE
ncbi:MAG: DUF2812 domain-containing protein [Candidatus Woodwardiibium sp.]